MFLSVGQLMRDAWRAIYAPRDAFERIRPRNIAYGRAYLVLFLLGVCWINLHGFLLFTEPVWITWEREVLYAIAFGLSPIVSWIFFALLMRVSARMLRVAPAELSEIEQGVFYLLLLWLLLPLFDIPHLFFSVPLVTLPIFGTHPIHFAHLFAALFIPIELYFFMRRFFQRKTVFVLSVALLALPIAKFVFEDIYFLIERGFFDLGLIDGKYDDSLIGAIGNGIATPMVLAWHGYVRGKRGVRAFLPYGAFLSAVFLIVTPLAIRSTPLFPDFASDSGYVDATRSTEPVVKDFIYQDVLFVPREFIERRQGGIMCRVRFLSQTSAPSSWARCDLAPGPAAGVGDFLLLGERFNDISGESLRETAWDMADASDVLVPMRNDIRVHVEVAPGERVVFSGVWIELDQE